MKPFFNSSTRRNAAFAILLVWLFALGSGVANACLIQTEKSHGYGLGHGHESLTTHPSAAEAGHAISAAHADPMRDHDSTLTGSKSQCLKVCDDGSQSLLKQRAGFDLKHADLMPLLPVSWATAASVVLAGGLAVIQRPPYPGLPIRIRLSRLAL